MTEKPSLVVSVTLGALLLSTASASAQELASPLDFKPKWTRFQTWEYIAAPTLLLASSTVRLATKLGSANVNEGFLFDDWGTENLTLDEERSVTDVVDVMGDGLYYSALAYSVLDPFLSAGVFGGNWDTAAQLMLMNLEAFSLVTSVLFFTQLGIRRSRPRSIEGCKTGGKCSQSDRRSFPGGHLSIVTTTAALTCQHHDNLPLYGSRALDMGACGFWSGAVVVVFLSRIATGAHYLTDQVLALGLGIVAGYAVPQLLHYGNDPTDGDADSATFTVTPWVEPTERGWGAAGLSAAGYIR